MPINSPDGIALSRPGLPDGTRIGVVRLQVAELKSSCAFYQQTLGLRIIAADGNHASLGVEGFNDTLLELHEVPGSAPVPRGGRIGLYHFAILVPTREALGRFVQHLGAIGVRFGAADHLVSEAVYLTDPDGLGIEVYADRPKSAWRMVNGEIVMTSEQLDVAGLIRQIANGSWTGMPPGTIIGHIHLQVGDIDRAAAFYHNGLGFDTTVSSYPGALFMSAGGYHHHLGINTWSRDAIPAGATDARLISWELIVPSMDDAASAVRRLDSSGYGVERTSDGGIFRDPWGTQLMVRASRPGT